jgi:hypothetical protein
MYWFVLQGVSHRFQVELVVIGEWYHHLYMQFNKTKNINSMNAKWYFLQFSCIPMKYCGVSNEMTEVFSKEPTKPHLEVASGFEILQITTVFPGPLNWMHRKSIYIQRKVSRINYTKFEVATYDIRNCKVVWKCSHLPSSRVCNNGDSMKTWLKQGGIQINSNWQCTFRYWAIQSSALVYNTKESIEY